MANIWTSFLRLLPSNPLLVGTVADNTSEDGTSVLTLPDGSIVRVRGHGVAVGSKAFFRAGVIEGEAPDLPAYVAEI